MTAPGDNIPSVLFVCWGNSCRSVMAEAFGNRRYGSSARFSSVGLHIDPGVDSTEAVEALREFGIHLKDHTQREVGSVDLQSFSCVVAMDREIARELRTLTSREIIVWNIKDPWGGNPAEYHRCGLRILKELAALPVLRRNA